MLKFAFLWMYLSSVRCEARDEVEPFFTVEVVTVIPGTKGKVFAVIIGKITAASHGNKAVEPGHKLPKTQQRWVLRCTHMIPTIMW